MGQLQEFSAIDRDYRARVRGFLAKMVGSGDAEDLVQEVFTRAHRSLGEFRGECALQTWLFRIAANCASDHLRRARARPGPAGASERDASEDGRGEAAPLPSPEDDAIRQQQGNCVRGVVEALPETYRTVVALSEFGELTDPEIAQVLDVSVGTVKIRLHRARLRLKRELESHCVLTCQQDGSVECEPKR